MPYTIQTLPADDVERFRQLLALFAAVFEESHDAVSSDYLRRLLGSADFVAIVALDGGKVVGGLTLRLWHDYTSEQRLAYLYDLAVTDSHQRRGIATGLIAAARAFAYKNKIHEMWVQAEAIDEHAVAFYRSLGVSEMEVRHFELLSASLQVES